ncbi:MAG: hypothetical protein P8180_07915 [Gammaproteobacteria bacterium]|jgi:hypothetical protein
MTTPEDRKPESIPAASNGFTVTASPLNGVKLELALVLCLNLLLWLVAGSLVGGGLAELAVLAAGGFGGMAWLVLRTRRVLARQLSRVEKVTAGRSSDTC